MRTLTFYNMLDVVGLIAITWNILLHPDAGGKRGLQDVHLDVRKPIVSKLSY